LPNGHWLELTGPIRTSPFAIARVDDSPAYAKEIKEYWLWVVWNLGSVTPGSGQFTLLVLKHRDGTVWLADHVYSV
jgi:hypothetical protein